MPPPLLPCCLLHTCPPPVSLSPPNSDPADGQVSSGLHPTHGRASGRGRYAVRFQTSMCVYVCIHICFYIYMHIFVFVLLCSVCFFIGHKLNLFAVVRIDLIKFNLGKATCATTVLTSTIKNYNTPKSGHIYTQRVKRDIHIHTCILLYPYVCTFTKGITLCFNLRTGL